MKLYMHPVSMTSRPVRLFIAEHNIPAEEVTVDLMKGDHYKPPFTTINPNRQVPVLEDEGFRLTECSAILKYLADKVNSPAYPKDPPQPLVGLPPGRPANILRPARDPVSNLRDTPGTGFQRRLTMTQMANETGERR